MLFICKNHVRFINFTFTILYITAYIYLKYFGAFIDIYLKPYLSQSKKAYSYVVCHIS